MTQNNPNDETSQGRHRREDDDLDAPTVDMRQGAPKPRPDTESSLARWSGRSTHELKTLGITAAIVLVLVVAFSARHIDIDLPQGPSPDTYGDFNRGQDEARYYLERGDSRDLAYLMCEDSSRAKSPTTDREQWLSGCRYAVDSWEDSDWEYGFPTRGE